MPPDKPLSKGEWIDKFALELVDLRKELGLRYARTVATHAWVHSQAMTPTAAALRWTVGQDERRKKP